MLDLKREIAEILAKLLEDMDVEQIYGMLEQPPSPEMGDLAFPCFKLSRIFRKPPADIARELANKIPISRYIERVEPVSGYLNFFFKRSAVISDVLKQVLTERESFGSSWEGKGKTIVVDYSAPNIAKPFHIGHLLSTIIGHSLCRIFKFLGYNVVGINHLGDWGTQFGKLIAAYRRWGSRERVERDQIKELMDLYVRFHEEAEKDPSLEDEGRNWFARLEKGDREALELWQWFKNISLEEFKRVYRILGIEFDSYAGESFYVDKVWDVVEELRSKNLLKESEGARIVDLEPYGMPPFLILKKDGSTLYATRDIAAALYRKKAYDFHKCVYVVGATQILHFRQWIKVIELMGYRWAKDIVHVPFGTVSLEGKKLATRKGQVVLLEDLLTEAVKKTLEIIEEKNPGMENKNEVARQVGVGAVIFSHLYSSRIKDISFSWEEALNFDGETGPYVQYTHARTCSVLQKAGYTPGNSFDAGLLDTKEEYELAMALYRFPEKVREASGEYEPSVITRYLVEVAQAFNRFYHEHPILVEDEALRAARLALVDAARIVLSNGLWLIGLTSPERI